MRKSYIGSKVIQAEPQEKDGQPGYAVFYPDDYKSWSPKSVFEEAYRLLNTGEIRMIADAAEKPTRDERGVLDLDEFPIVGEVKITGGEKGDEPLPFEGPGSQFDRRRHPE